MFLLKRLSPHTLFSRTSPYSIFTALCSTSSPSHLIYSHPDSTRNVRVSVWWDLETCNVPSGVNVFRGAQAITAAIESSGIKGPIQITAFGDMLPLARTNQEAFSSTAINFTHIPHGKGSANTLSADLFNWVSNYRPPAHIFLITDDIGSAYMLHHLRLQNYNILLATKECSFGLLKSAATIMWDWDALVRGENLTGRYFNRPSNGSWYGYYEGPLEDPFTEIEKASFVPANQPDEVLQQKHSKSKTHEIFSHDSFWIDLHTFINTAVGSLIIAESRNREKMSYYLQKYGPSVLKFATKSDVLILVDMLITEKKWVLESPYRSRPFKLTSSARITSANSDCTYSDYDEFDYSEDDFSDSDYSEDDFSDSE